MSLKIDRPTTPQPFPIPDWNEPEEEEEYEED